MVQNVFEPWQTMFEPDENVLGERCSKLCWEARLQESLLEMLEMMQTA